MREFPSIDLFEKLEDQLREHSEVQDHAVAREHPSLAARLEAIVVRQRVRLDHGDGVEAPRCLTGRIKIGLIDKEERQVGAPAGGEVVIVLDHVRQGEVGPREIQDLGRPAGRVAHRPLDRPAEVVSIEDRVPEHEGVPQEEDSGRPRIPLPGRAPPQATDLVRTAEVESFAEA